MTRRYINAILIGTSIGLFALAGVSLTPVVFNPWDTGKVIYARIQPIPLWDFHQFSPTGECSFDWKRRSYGKGPAHELQYKAIFLRFCMLFLQDGFYYLAAPILLACLMTKFNEFDAPYSGWVCLRRSIKLTGGILLSIYLIFSAGAIFWTHSFEEYIVEMIRLFWAGLVLSFGGLAEILLLSTFFGHLYNMACEKDANLKISTVE